MRKRTIIVTEQMNLHLTWNNSYLYIKPLPAYMLCIEFWKDHLCDDPERARGFLMSYSWLIGYNSDYLIVIKGYHVLCLFHSTITWPRWRLLMEEFLDALNSEALKIKINFSL